MSNSDYICKNTYRLFYSTIPRVYKELLAHWVLQRKKTVTEVQVTLAQNLVVQKAAESNLKANKQDKD